jgi:hypothetical protein
MSAPETPKPDNLARNVALVFAMMIVGGSLLALDAVGAFKSRAIPIPISAPHVASMDAPQSCPAPKEGERLEISFELRDGMLPGKCKTVRPFSLSQVVPKVAPKAGP